MTNSEPIRLLVARIGRAHGIKGEVTIQVHTDAPGTRFTPGARLFADTRLLTVRSSRDHNGVLLIGFDGVDDRNTAEAMRGQKLYADVDATAEREDDAWFDHELIGLRAIDPAGVELGKVVGVEHLPAQDLLEIKRPDGERRLVPLVAHMVPEVDIEAGHVVVDAPPGLIDDLDD